MLMLLDHASPECHVGRYRFTSHPTCGRRISDLSSRMHRNSSGEHMRIFVLLARAEMAELSYNTTVVHIP